MHVSREVLFEAHHRCAVCCEPTPLERAHIRPWSKSSDHRIENLIALCANCHERADKEQWGESYLRRYKRKPCALQRDTLPPLKPSQRALIDLVIDSDPDQMTPTERRRLVSMVAAYSGVSIGSITIISVEPANSSRVRMALPRSAARRLHHGFRTSDRQLYDFLELFKLQRVSDVSLPPRRSARPLDVVEWIGNRLPDPIALFLVGMLAVLVASHMAAPELPAGIKIRWEKVGSIEGGVDERRAVIGKVLTSPNGREVFHPGHFRVVPAPDGVAVHLQLDTGDVVAGDDGQPIDFAKNGCAVFPRRPSLPAESSANDIRLDTEATDAVLFARSLLTSDGIYWVLSSMKANFLGFAPLGVVLLAMLGIRSMEHVGLLAALLRVNLKRMPPVLLTPSVIFLGLLSGIGADAGYVILPPIAAAAYAVIGRSPLAGVAAAFAGCAAGFNANLFITVVDPMLAELTQAAAQQVEPSRQVAATASWYFMTASTIFITLIGWATTAFVVERRLSTKSADYGGPLPTEVLVASSGEDDNPDRLLGSREVRALRFSVLSLVVGIAAACVLALRNGYPLHGTDGAFPRWVAVIVPLTFLVTIVPAVVYGTFVGAIRGANDVVKLLVRSMADAAPYIVLAFVAGQFISYLEESNLGAMLALSIGGWLLEYQVPGVVLLVALIPVTMVLNIIIPGMSTKYVLLAPVFVPTLMLVGIRPELTMVAYRIGDSTTDIVTPMNVYLVVMLACVRKYAPRAGVGTLLATMLPYTIIFSVMGALLVVGWWASGLPLGPGDINASSAL